MRKEIKKTIKKKELTIIEKIIMMIEEKNMMEIIEM